MDIKRISEDLVVLRAALVAKTGEEPFLEPTMTIGHDAKCCIILTRGYNDSNYRIGIITTDGPDQCLAEAFAAVEAMRTPVLRALNDLHDKLGNLIGDANKLYTDDEVMALLTKASRLMAKNLQTQPVRIVEAGDCPF